jgi:NAD(P)-dependent dehydrogenase (short-subunit alcohol dehydrogenase family)
MSFTIALPGATAHSRLVAPTRCTRLGASQKARSRPSHQPRTKVCYAYAVPQLTATLAAAATPLAGSFTEALSSPSGLLVAAALVAAAFTASVVATGSQGAPPDGVSTELTWPAKRECKDAVLVFGAGGRLGREVVLALLKEGRCVAAAARDASKTTTTLTEACLAAGVSTDKLFVRGGVDVTGELSAELFAGCSQVVCSTGAIFGKNAEGQMGYIDNMTSERVDKLGNANIAAAAAKHLTRPSPPSFQPVATFASEADLQAWRRMDDVIMGGSSSSAWRLVTSSGAPGEPTAWGMWSGDLITEGGGFCGCRCDGLALDLSGADGLVLRLRGDGQRYKLNLKTALYDGKPECTYQAVIDTSSVAPGAWGDVKLHWHQFVPVVRQVEDPDRPALDPATVRSLGFVLSKFEFNGLPNYRYKAGPFSLEVQSILPFAEPRPALVMLSSAGVERNARIGNDAEARKKDIPIVQLNPGGVLNWKYQGESAIRFSSGGLPYAIIRPTGLDAGADTSSLLELGQGDSLAGKVSRPECALATVAALGSPAGVNRTFELRRSEAAVDAGKTSTLRDVQRQMLVLVPDEQRTAVGLRPLPAPCDPPAAVTPERKQEILSRTDVQASLAAGRGGRTRGADESAPDAQVKTSAVEDASLWIASWRKLRQAEGAAAQPQKETAVAR